MKRLEIACNVSIILVSLAIIFVLGKQHLYETRAVQKPTPAALDIAKITALAQERTPTFVLALSTQCHYCTDSMPFYRRLLSAAPPSVHLVAVFPQAVADAKAYVEAKQLNVQDIRQISFSSANIQATPTLALVGGDRRLINSWVGQLSPESERQVIAAVLSAANHNRDRSQ